MAQSQSPASAVSTTQLVIPSARSRAQRGESAEEPAFLPAERTADSSPLGRSE